MTIELTRDEAEILIAVLTFSEGAAHTLHVEAISEALKVLRPWRSALMGAYLRDRIPTLAPAPAPAWQPLETAPKDGTLVIVALIRDGVIWRVSDAVFQQIGWYTKNGNACHWATHWQPLPPPPPPDKEPVE